jgi:hypothetical protein
VQKVGQLPRRFTPRVGSIVAFAGTGIGNVLLPSIPHRRATRPRDFGTALLLLAALGSCRWCGGKFAVTDGDQCGDGAEDDGDQDGVDRDAGVAVCGDVEEGVRDHFQIAPRMSV